MDEQIEAIYKKCNYPNSVQKLLKLVKKCWYQCYKQGYTNIPGQERIRTTDQSDEKKQKKHGENSSFQSV